MRQMENHFEHQLLTATVREFIDELAQVVKQNVHYYFFLRQ